MRQSSPKLQTLLNQAFNKVVEEFAEDDPAEPVDMQTVLNALDDTKADTPAILKAARDRHDDWLSSQEGPTYDEALAMKCDALAREDESRNLK